MLDGGADPKVVQEMLGHASPLTTSDTPTSHATKVLRLPGRSSTSVGRDRLMRFFNVDRFDGNLRITAEAIGDLTEEGRSRTRVTASANHASGRGRSCWRPASVVAP